MYAPEIVFRFYRLSVTESVFSKRRLWRERVPGRDSRKAETVGAGEEGETTPLTKRNLLLEVDDMFFEAKKQPDPEKEKNQFLPHSILSVREFQKCFRRSTF